MPFRLIKGLLCLLFSSFWAQSSLAQVAPDTLPEVQVFAPAYRKYAVGSQIFVQDSALLAQNASRSLGEFLQQYSTAYIKQYGNGMLQSISLRGTGAGHTAVLWQGVNINSPTLGEADFSLYPITAFEQVSLQMGASSALWGSDALGGSILLESAQPDFRPQLQVAAQQEIGSFGRLFSNLQVKAGHNKWQSNTRFYRFALENNFEVRERNRPSRQMNNAAVFSQGLVQDFHYQLQKNHTLSLHTWWHQADRQLQQFQATQNDESLRLLAAYRWQQSKGFLELKSGYIKDYMLYNAQSRTQTQRWIGQATYEYTPLPRWQMQAGAHLNHIWMQVDNYLGNPEQSRLDLFWLNTYQVAPALALSLHLRQAWVSDFDAPLAPSLGLEWRFWESNGHRLSTSASLSQSYRIPNLNAMYWQPGGNPNIRSERALNYEAGLQYQFKKSKFSLESNLSAYQMQVSDWILWLARERFWSPENLRQVRVRGLEAQAKGQYNISPRLQAVFGGSYAYTASTNIQGDADSPLSAGKQLPYVPFHRAQAWGELRYRGFWLQGSWSYTDVRFLSTDNQLFLEGFHLVQASLGKKWQWAGSSLDAMLQVNNLLDSVYYNVGAQAMPLRNYQFSLRYHFQKP
jgi:iron complex outermembrane receptor protein